MTIFVILHVALIAISNILVQFPVKLFGLHATYGAITYPFIFILSDLATRQYGQRKARKIIFYAMLPGFLTSFLFTLIANNDFNALLQTSRIATACFVAYTLGQLLDIMLFSQLRNNKRWFVAPLISGSFSNIADTYLFFFLAFFHSSGQVYMSNHWLQFANTDMAFKCSISLLAFLPFYGLLIHKLPALQTVPASAINH